MLNIDDIQTLIKLVDESNLSELNYEQDGTKLVLRKEQGQKLISATSNPASSNVAPVQPATAANSAGQEFEQAEQSATAATTKEHLHTITSPMVGTFYTAPSPDSDPYVKKGDSVHEESVVCIVEAMKLMNEIEAEVKGSIVEILAENGELVEYGQPLFTVEPK